MVDGAGRTDTGVHATGQVIAFTYPGDDTGGRAPAGGQRPAPAGRRDPRPPAGTRRVPSPLCGAVPGVPLHRLERAAQPASRAPGARGAGADSNITAMARRRVGLRGPARLLAFGGTRTGARSGPCTWSGSGRDGHLVTIDVRADSFLRGQVRRMVAGLLEVGLDRSDDSALRAALAGREPALNGAAAPAKGLCLRRVVIGDGRRGTTRKTRNEREREDLYASGERDRATLVRRRRDGRDARPPCDADRACPRGQAQAHLRGRTWTPVTT